MDNLKNEILNYIENNYDEMINKLDNEINNRIKAIRKSLKLSQSNFGKSLFISQDTVSLLERGKQNPTERQILDICEKFNVNEEWLMFGKGEMFRDVLKELDLHKDIKQTTNDLYSLDEEDREMIKDLIRSMKSKYEKRES
ncbi:helix-turn-helix domain-containing protein [Clostridium perfringens]|uniref:helix-turn-helix domain-containing protein n=1 Tax=Clostridium perfringens TaxID=1502 RepID=UPI00224683A5|nr:helix-turn-helix domain-containing protein [Clostridium perfringens]MCX0390777.1 helix-turn-helix domain-containing protein [Clostridium perfringens]MDM0746459.1 helix-turn-helix domain-containing protein [Clostridium perfringens]MDM0973247.1 helix-turn-helix domain-containing protein [Clostridium perfringens]